MQSLRNAANLRRVTVALDEDGAHVDVDDAEALTRLELRMPGLIWTETP